MEVLGSKLLVIYNSKTTLRQQPDPVFYMVLVMGNRQSERRFAGNR